jgi:putative PIN family toxin of toxin-antitoxin system
LPSPVVLDVGIVIGALTGREDSQKSQVVRAALDGRFPFVTSEDFFAEFYRVVGYPAVEPYIWSAARAVRMIMDIFTMGEVRALIKYPWPSVPDDKDHWMLDLAWDAKAAYIVSEDPHLTDPDMPFDVEVLSTHELLQRLSG